MNLKRRVWLPPDGDSRLVRFQQEVAASVGMTGGAYLPPHLDLASRVPEGEVSSGPWLLLNDEPVLGASDARGELGVFRLGIVSNGFELSQLPAPPQFRWNRGVTAVLNLEVSDPSFARWTWESRRGWKVSPPKE